MIRRFLLTIAYIAAGLIQTEGLALNNLNGSARLGSALSESDSTESQSYNQYFSINYHRNILPYVRARISLRYSSYQTDNEIVDDSWHGEVQPSGQITWDTPFFQSNAHYHYREARDLVEYNNLLNRSAGVSFKTKFVNLPQSIVRYDWSRNNSGSGIVPQNNEDRRFQYIVKHEYKNIQALYNYSNSDVENFSSHISQNLQHHVFRLDASQGLFQNRLRLSGDYLYNHTRRSEDTGQPVEPYVPINIIQGLYAEDNTPEFGALETFPTLIDQNVTDATSPQIDIGGAAASHNIGVDLGITRSISLVYLYTDRLSGDGLEWTVYASYNNLEWSELSEEYVTLYNATFRRYEISFTSVASRYFKLVNSGVNEEPQVLVTEIQVFLQSEEAERGADKTENHRVNLGGAFQINPKLSIRSDVMVGTRPETDTQEGRQEFNIAGQLAYRPSNIINTIAQYQRDYSDYTGSSIGSFGSERYSLTFVVRPMETIQATVSGSHLTSLENEEEVQRVSNGLIRVSTQWISGLATTSEIGYSQSDGLVLNSTVGSWTYRISADTKPFPNVSVTGGYRIQTYDSDQIYAIDRRDAVSVHVTYRTTPSIFLRGSGSYSKEGENENISQDYSLSWRVSQRVSASAVMRLSGSESGINTETYSVQNSYILSSRTGLNLGYSLNKSDLGETIETSSFRVGFHTSF